MEDDDELGDLYIDVFRPLDKKFPPQDQETGAPAPAVTAASSHGRSIDLVFNSGDEENLGGDQHLKTWDLSCSSSLAWNLNAFVQTLPQPKGFDLNLVGNSLVGRIDELVGNGEDGSGFRVLEKGESGELHQSARCFIIVAEGEYDGKTLVGKGAKITKKGEKVYISVAQNDKRVNDMDLVNVSDKKKVGPEQTNHRVSEIGDEKKSQESEEDLQIVLDDVSRAPMVVKRMQGAADDGETLVIVAATDDVGHRFHQAQRQIDDQNWGGEEGVPRADGVHGEKDLAGAAPVSVQANIARSNVYNNHLLPSHFKHSAVPFPGAARGGIAGQVQNGFHHAYGSRLYFTPPPHKIDPTLDDRSFDLEREEIAVGARNRATSEDEKLVCSKKQLCQEYDNVEGSKSGRLETRKPLSGSSYEGSSPDEVGGKLRDRGKKERTGHHLSRRQLDYDSWRGTNHDHDIAGSTRRDRDVSHKYQNGRVHDFHSARRKGKGCLREPESSSRKKREGEDSSGELKRDDQARLKDNEVHYARQREKRSIQIERSEREREHDQRYKIKHDKVLSREKEEEKTRNYNVSSREYPPKDIGRHSYQLKQRDEDNCDHRDQLSYDEKRSRYKMHKRKEFSRKSIELESGNHSSFISSRRNHHSSFISSRRSQDEDGDLISEACVILDSVPLNLLK